MPVIQALDPPAPSTRPSHDPLVKLGMSHFEAAQSGMPSIKLKSISNQGIPGIPDNVASSTPAPDFLPVEIEHTVPESAHRPVEIKTEALSS